ncbi:aconitase [Trichococcus patagoniensis]|uniref:Aconitate hydratase n=1 Tax=Trichococcus patagoniensis TaxID=382641 RepID=A0A2T5IRD3_9LACT|nr:aconitate hydratase AcnA [Trichococcus patagoniensis]PTQ86382.1 aconitase [Trichococcus patagoniensis]
MSESNQNAIASFSLNGHQYEYYKLKKLENNEKIKIAKLPYSIRVLLESLLRQVGESGIKEEHVVTLSNWSATETNEGEIPFKPSRVILQDFTGVPAVVDLASLRKTVYDLGGDPAIINPEVPVDLVIDHSVQVDNFGSPQALIANMKMEFLRNQERYQFLSWAQKAFDNYRAVPPATGIVHQVNIEYLASVVTEKAIDENRSLVFPDTLVGTDSHTTMANALGVLGWGVGGIEAEASMLGEPSFFPVPEVVGVRFINSLQEAATATDLALKVTQKLREMKVVGKFVEFFGPGLSSMTLADRATIANMAPEYGATCGFFPVDDEVLNYLTLTGRDEKHVAIVKEYVKANDLYYRVEDPEPEYTTVVEIDLSTIEANVAGPKRPQDLVPVSKLKEDFQRSLVAPKGNAGFGLSEDETEKEVSLILDGEEVKMKTGDIAIAAITSCTNTSNPYVMLSAGLLAKRAVELGLNVPKYVKTSLAPGSKVVTAYLDNAGLLPYLEELGFNTVGYGCTTCIGNSGPLLPEVEEAIKNNDLLVSSALSGNRNFEGRIHALVKANYLASPPLVVAYALAGTMNIDLKTEPIGNGKDGQPVYLADLWPERHAVEAMIRDFVTPEIFKEEYLHVFDDNAEWNAIETNDDALYQWEEGSTYIANPPFFENLSPEPKPIVSLNGLSVLGKFGDSVTTDHISPAGSIDISTPAGQYLSSKGVGVRDFNSYGARRGNHEVMMRGTLANMRIRNQLVSGKDGGFTIYWPTGEEMSIFDASERYRQNGTGLVIFAGDDYGMGSSRDWAAKGVKLLGVEAVIAKSYERIHRSNLVMMGVLPLQYQTGQDAESLGLDGSEKITIDLNDSVGIHAEIPVTAVKSDGQEIKFTTIARFDSEVDMTYYRNGGILPMVIRKKMGLAY